jgi:hypothetical protein
MKLRAKAKFYIKSKEIYVDLFSRDMKIYFCYQGAEYKHIEGKIFYSISAKGEESTEIKIVDWHMPALLFSVINTDNQYYTPQEFDTYKQASEFIEKQFHNDLKIGHSEWIIKEI